MLESYILGTTSRQENELLHGLFKTHPALLTEVEAIEQSLIRASARSAKPVSPAVKQKIMAGLSFQSEGAPPDKTISLHNDEATASKLKLYGFAIAASLLLFITSFVYNILLQKQLDSLSSEMAQINASKSVMADQLQIQQASLSDLNNRFQIVSNPKVKTIALNGMNSMAGHSAAVHWNAETDEVYFDVSQLPQSPAGKQYQLWAIVAGKPVDAGMLDLAQTHAVFQKMKAVKGAQAFAVTIEKMGGSAVPSMETMCLMGNV